MTEREFNTLRHDDGSLDGYRVWQWMSAVEARLKALEDAWLEKYLFRADREGHVAAKTEETKQ
jgi:hypothetical protein